MREDKTEVLVVGAGPVGLITALALAEAGVSVQIVDRESRTTTRSYACALHSRTLELLAGLGLADSVLSRGRKVTSVAFYDGQSRQAEIRLDKQGGAYPFVLIVPQNAFEEALEQRLQQKGVSVQWNHRFADLSTEQDGVVVELERLGGTSTGYIVPHWQQVVDKRFPIRCQFLVGADGHNSVVRDRLRIEYSRLVGPSFFAAYEFEADRKADDEVRVVLDEGTTNVLWPLPGNKHRWTFQLVKSEISSEFPAKERRAVRVQDSVVDEELRSYVQGLAARRAPWFKAGVKEVTWCTDVVFEHRLAKSFGKGHCWLAGDAAHQAGPVGAQSMNIGMIEGLSLSNKIAAILRKGAAFGSLESYNAERLAEWNPLLRPDSALKVRPDTSSWVKSRTQRLLACLPASGQGLNKLAEQMKLDLALS